MTPAQVQSMLQAALTTNDPVVIANMGSFMVNAASRIRGQDFSAILQLSANLSLGTDGLGPLPVTCLGVASVMVANSAAKWVSLGELGELKLAAAGSNAAPPTPQEPGTYSYAVWAGNIEIYPVPAAASLVVVNFYSVDQNAPANVAAAAPALLYHYAMAEGLTFQGDYESAMAEENLAGRIMEQVRGKASNGRMSLGGVA